MWKKIPINSYLSLSLFFLHVDQLSVELLLILFGIYTILCTSLNDYMYACAMVSTVFTKLAQLMLS